MNLIEESFQKKAEKKKKMTTKIILASIILVILIIIGIFSYLVYIQSSQLKLTIDGKRNDSLKSLLVFEDDGTIYAPIKEIAQYFNYDSFDGEYKADTESRSKCYVQCNDEIANFVLQEKTIYKLDLSSKDANYELVEIRQPVKGMDGKLYVSTEGLEKAFNISFEYDKEKNEIIIWTLPYLYDYYSESIVNQTYNYAKLSDEFKNKKAILEDKLIALKDETNNKYGVVDTEGKTILEPKYDKITYLPETKDYLVEVDQKVGIMTANKQTKVQIIYDSIELIDSKEELYIAKKDEKYGVLDSKGTTKIFIEYDEIGMDISKFQQNDLKSKYILIDNLIPVRKDELWGLYDKNGNLVVDFDYSSFGYIASSNRNAMNLLVIPKYNVIVACKDEKYTLINSSGKELFDAVADDIYMTISGGEKHYYISVNDQRIDAEDFLNKNGVNVNNSSNTSQNKKSSSKNKNQTNTSKNQTNTTEESTSKNTTREENEEDQEQDQEENNEDVDGEEENGEDEE